ncbi:glycosyltransferase [Plantactinospora siamensis]|uniref:Glycosyltransferase n=1 Tax=Plantactinospora siamensis TaxID=555372 RepID=A0ABV6NZZ7_9ACTN
MARILVASLPFAGHVGPLGALSGELVDRGHAVTAYTGTRYRDRFAGADLLRWNRAPDFDDADLAATFPRIGDGKGARGAIANSRYVLFGTAAAQAQDILAAARAAPFDLIVTDQLAFGGALAGEKLGVPWVSVAVTPLNLPSRDLPPPGMRVRPAAGRTIRPATGRALRTRDAALRGLLRAGSRLLEPQITRMRATVGLGPAASGGIDRLYSPHLVLAQGVPGLEYHRSDLPPHVRFVGRLARQRAATEAGAVQPDPVQPDPVQAAAAPGCGPALRAVAGGADPEPELPPWWPELAAARAAGRPVVHVTQGTLDVDPTDLLRPAVTGLAGEPALVVCTTGGRDPAVLDPLPDNARVARFLPHDLLLPLVDAMVTNGGWGGVLNAVHAGVPLVVAGGSLDKPEVARRVAWSGVGLDLRTGRPRPERIRRAVTEVLARPAFRRRTAELSAALDAAGGTPRAAALIEELLAR